MKISARSAIKERIVDIKRGAVMAQVTLDIGGQTIKAAITMDSLDELGVQVGDHTYAVIKATSVMVAKD